MEFQFHPASSRRPVRTVVVGDRGERALIAFAAGGALLLLSLWVTAPLFASRRFREENSARIAADNRRLHMEQARVAELAAKLKQRALDRGDLLNRVAFLYGVSSARWPRVLNPERAVLGQSEPEALVARLEAYVRALEKARTMLSDRESAEPELAARVPALMPVSGGVYEAVAKFGPRVSPWTGEEEFFPGVDIAAPTGTPVLAPGSGTIAFTGRVRRSIGGWLWRLGNVIVLSHGRSGSTVFGNLGRIDVRRGQRVERGQTLGVVGATGWSLSPQLHYEYWRLSGETPRPTDPLFAVLDGRPARPPASLEQMQATSAPGSLEPLPGVQIAASLATASEHGAAGRPIRRRRAFGRR